jgi:hypothetical protein
MMVTGGARLRLREVRVTNIRPSAACPLEEASGNGIRMGTTPDVEMDGEFGTTGSLDARNILVDRFFGDGILGLAFGEERAEIRVVESAISGGPARPGLFQAGVVVVANARAVLRDNTIGPIYCTDESCGDDLFESNQGAGIGTDSLQGNDNVVERNFIFGTDVGIWPFGGLSGISQNFLATKLYGLLLQDGDYRTDHNVIVSGQAGIVGFAVDAETTVRSRADFIAPNVAAPTLELEPTGLDATVVRTPR